MTTDANRDKILDRLRKLHATAQSYEDTGNQAAAAAFAGKVQELLLRHKLEMADVEMADESAADGMMHEVFDPLERNLDPTAPGRGRRRRVCWIEQLALSVSHAHCCQMTLSARRDGVITYIFVGHASDVALTTYMFTILARTAFRLASNAYRKAKAAGDDTDGFFTMYQRGYVSAISKRYAEARAGVENAVRAAGRGTALVRLDTIRAEIKAYEAQHFNVRPSAHIGGTTKFNPDAYLQGQKAGRDISLAARAVSGSTGQATPGALGAGARRLKKGDA